MSNLSKYFRNLTTDPAILDGIDIIDGGKWMPVKSESEILKMPTGTKVRIKDTSRAAPHFKHGGIITKNQIQEPHEYQYGIFTPVQSCFLFDFSEYEYLT